MKGRYLNFVALLGLSASIALLPSCTKKEGCTDPTASNYDAEADKDNGNCVYDDATRTGELTADETWDASRIYYLQGRVIVPSGVTLTISAGAIIKGKQGTETNASALVVAKGGRIIANGTASDPIIFTSELDNIELGQRVGTNLTKIDNEKWGGIVILGNAPISAENGDVSANIEGIPANLGYGVYGGSDASDDSGILNYVSIRHGGITIGEGNELNGLTLGGVGSGTTISNIEIYATLDDGIEFFGGTVNVSNALIFFQGDDGLDVDQNYAGTIDGFAVIHGDGIGTDEGLEIDGPEGTTNVNGQFTIKNGICKYVDAAGSGSAADLKSKAQGTIENVTFDYAALGGKPVKFRTGFDGACAHKNDAYKYLTTPSGAQSLVLTNCSFSGVSVYDALENLSATPPVPTTCPTELAASQSTAAGAVTSGSGSSFGYASIFNWGAAGTRGEL